MADPRSKALERGRAQEKAGQVAEAIQSYRDAGAIEDAARLLAANKRAPEAAQLLLASLGNVTASQVGQLDGPGRRRALLAGILLSRGADVPQAVELFLALGERARAVEALQRSGDVAGAARIEAGQGVPQAVLLARPSTASAGAPESAEAARKLESQGKPEVALEMWLRLKKFGEAARVARALGRLAEAAHLHADAGQPVEAAWCYRQLGDNARALEALVRVPRAEPRYRACAIEAIALASTLNLVSVAFEQFVADFVRTGPLSNAELPVFDKLAGLYLAHDILGNAREVLQKLVARAPTWQDATERLKLLEQKGRANPRLTARGLAHDNSLRALPLDELPPLEEPPRPMQDTLLLLGEAPSPFEELEPLEEDLIGVVEATRLVVADQDVDLSEGTLQELEPEPSAPPPVVVARALGPVIAEVDVDLNSMPPPPVQPAPAQPVASRRPAPALPAHAPTNPIPANARTSFIPGALVANRYRLEAQIGQGGMANVFRATDLELDEQVALKVFTLAEASDIAVQRFKQELKLSRQLTHPNIIRLHDIGVHEGHRYISMEFLQGESLKNRLLRPVEFVEALRILEQACAGLQAAHDMGVIHRDVKPDNFFLTKDGVVKVMDFGIAKQQAAPGVTVVGSIAGTPAYMSPEQVSNFSTVGPATDLYALGIMAYEIFTGAVPFTHDDLVPLLLLHVNQKPIPPSEKNPGVPEELDRVILRLLEKSPAARHPSARALQDEIRAIRQSYESAP